MKFEDIIRPVMDQLLEETASTMPDIPADLTKTYAKQGAWGGAFAGMSSGAYFGAGLGIAGGPLGAIAGTIPGAIIGGIVAGWSLPLCRSMLNNAPFDSDCRGQQQHCQGIRGVHSCRTGRQAFRASASLVGLEGGSPLSFSSGRAWAIFG